MVRAWTSVFSKDTFIKFAYKKIKLREKEEADFYFRVASYDWVDVGATYDLEPVSDHLCMGKYEILYRIYKAYGVRVTLEQTRIWPAWRLLDLLYKRPNQNFEPENITSWLSKHR